MKQFLRLFILALVRILGAPRVFIASRRVRNVPANPRILLIRPDHLGDLVLTTPVLDALKSRLPNAHITMMVGSWSSEVVARHPAIDRLITCAFPGFRRAAQGPLAPYVLLFQTARQLRRQHYDIAINLRPDFWWGAALLYLAAIPYRVGYAIAPGTPFLNHAISFHASEHATVSNLRLISTTLQLSSTQPLSEPYTPERYPLVFEPTSEEDEWVTRRLYENDIDEHASIIVIHPGTGAAVKLWRNEAWATCANRLLSAQSTPTHVILTGSPAERTMLTAIADEMHTKPLIVADATIGQLAALMRRATLVLGTDTGPLHLAVAQHTPTVTIFGPTDPRIFGPWGDGTQHIVVASTHRCPTCPVIPCGRLDFSSEELPAHPCTRLVSEQEVEQAALHLLDMASIMGYKKSQEI
ncbi:MAG TPA: glycosyltransferase family 9 protein [Ktedonobacter sp.]|nr:glycosyltransferase family 9 protein [Ktedonobacter sp.]